MSPDVEIKSLTGLRGLAACLVMLGHYFYGVNDLGPARLFIMHGYICVDLFFVLSGFVMAMSYGSMFKSGFNITLYLSFIYKRLGRIYPLYILVTIGAAALAGAGLVSGPPPAFGTLVSNVFLIQNWGLAVSISPTTWSISTEFAAYVLFPLLVAVVLARGWELSGLSVLTAICVLAYVASRTQADFHQAGDGVATGSLEAHAGVTVYPLFRCLAGFALGMAAYRLAEAPAVRTSAVAPYAADAVLVLIIALMSTSGYDVLLVVLFAPLVITLAVGRSFTRRLLETPLLYWLGLVSYSIYLVHLITDELFRRSIIKAFNALHLPHGFLFGTAATVCLVFAVSAVSYYGIEKPGRDAARRLIAARSRHREYESVV